MDLNRRLFLTTLLTGIGTIAASKLLKAADWEDISDISHKRLYATTDFWDNIQNYYKGSRYGEPAIRTADYDEANKSFLNRRQLDELHQFLASVGVTRHQWIIDTIWNLYEDYPHGFDLLEEAVNSAHKYGIEFFAVIKPFEGGGFGPIIPSTMPVPEGIACKDLRGIYPVIRPFVAANPDFNLKRKSGTYEVTTSLSTIRLIKDDDRPTNLKTEYLSLWTSPTNNRFIPYKGPVCFRETVEKRYRFPYWRQCRVIHLEGLQFPVNHSYVLIKCMQNGEDFSNEKGNILEFADSKGQIIPHTLSSGIVTFEEHKSFYHSRINQRMIRYLQHPEVQTEINDSQRMKEHYRDYYAFGVYNPTDRISFGENTCLAAACGKPEYLLGQLNPVYPEVQEHWLEMVQFCLDRRVDGINIRHSNHVLSPEVWEYGFNEPVLKKSNGKTDFPTISKIHGDAYTLFLQKVQNLLKSKKKTLTIHLEPELLMPDDRPRKLSSYPFNFEWQWRKWVKEIGNEFEIRGIFQLRPWNMDKAINIFGKLARGAGKPICLQGDFHGMSFEGPFDSLEAELELVKKHKYLDGYIFYETANITRLNDNGKIEGSFRAADMLKKF